MVTVISDWWYGYVAPVLPDRVGALERLGERRFEEHRVGGEDRDDLSIWPLDQPRAKVSTSSRAFSLTGTGSGSAADMIQRYHTSRRLPGPCASTLARFTPLPYWQNLEGPWNARPLV